MAAPKRCMRVCPTEEEEEEREDPRGPRPPAGKRRREKRLIVLLEGASLETVRSLLMLLDSPLNRAGLLQVYIHTQRNVLIEVNPQTRIPRTFPRFCGLMVQLLHKLSVRAADGPQKLLKVIKNPLTDHLPVGCLKITTSFTGEITNCVRDLVPAEEPMLFVVGAFAHGSVNLDYTERSVSISQYPLSAALTCAKICTAFEEVWKVL
ncbi:hypothetical protein FKM82_019942 [Ascaphus truei]